MKAKNAGDADQLETFGFEKVSAKTVGLSPKSCNSNPWDDTNREGNARDLGQWAESLGADVSHAGFVKPTEPRIVCQSCGCPRGDLAVVIAENASSKAKLESEGFGALD